MNRPTCLEISDSHNESRSNWYGTVRFWPILLKKAVFAGAAFQTFRKRTALVLLREF